ncbi:MULTISPECIES: methylated-DNA--[protein]-cysteine S-methyltransferase [Methylomonas]|uniref:methylated-DNA--[protein]-cysteine S-methyltransferase n=1 Tax=Methylomonas TaxID=416 RepID=UPI001231A9D2|nr:methylated-DNA--[protein]-cysteine S-methyltransferase [Methylomonas rhizoryzae]
MNIIRYTLFDTAFGSCAVVWKTVQADSVAVVGFQLPEASPQQTLTHMLGKWPAVEANRLPTAIKNLVKQVKLHLSGQPQTFADIVLEVAGASPFTQRIYAAARAIPAGRTLTYGQLAEAAGKPGAARAVGSAMSKNPIPLLIPCHRVIGSGNKLCGFSAHGGLDTKAKMLALEGVSLVRRQPITTPNALKRAARQLAKQDPRLAELLSRPLQFNVLTQESPYLTLLTAVVHQQLTPRAAKSILDRIAALYPEHVLPAPARLLDTPDSQLSAAGLSLSKTRALKDIAAKALDGVIPSLDEIALLGDEAIIRRLTAIHGVGRWTVEMLLIFHLGRPDVLPVDDYALRKSMAAALALPQIPTPKQAAELGEAWRPYRTIASLYLWQANNSPYSSANQGNNAL